MTRRAFAALALAAPQPSRLLLAEDYNKARTYSKEFQSIAPGWRVRTWHGEWLHTPAGLQSRWTSGHMPVLAYEGSFQDVVIEIEFRYRQEAGRKALCRLSATNPGRNPRAYSVSVWANHDSGERPTGLVLEHDEWKPGYITTVDRKAAQFVPDTWHKLRLTLTADQATATSGGLSVTGRFDKFGLPKTLLTIGAGLSPHDFRHLRVWEGNPVDPA